MCEKAVINNRPASVFLKRGLMYIWSWYHGLPRTHDCTQQQWRTAQRKREIYQYGTTPPLPPPPPPSSPAATPVSTGQYGTCYLHTGGGLRVSLTHRPHGIQPRWPFPTAGWWYMLASGQLTIRVVRVSGVKAQQLQCSLNSGQWSGELLLLTSRWPSGLSFVYSQPGWWSSSWHSTLHQWPATRGSIRLDVVLSK